MRSSAPEDLLLELLERGRHEALGVGERLPADPVGRDAFPVRVADLERIAEDAVERDPQRRDPGALALLRLDREQRALRVAPQAPQRVELRVGAVADDAAGRARTGGSGASVASTRRDADRRVSGMPSHERPEAARPQARRAAARTRRHGAAARRPSAATSRGPAVPTATRAKRRSRSPTSSSARLQASAASAARRDELLDGVPARLELDRVASRDAPAPPRSARAPSGVRVRSSRAQRLRSRGPVGGLEELERRDRRGVEAHPLAEARAARDRRRAPSRRAASRARRRGRPPRPRAAGGATGDGRGAGGRRAANHSARRRRVGKRRREAAARRPPGSRTSRGRKSASASGDARGRDASRVEPPRREVEEGDAPRPAPPGTSAAR